MKMNRAIVWFRNDLRLADHEPLTKAIHSAKEIIPVYCLDPRRWGEDPYGQVKTGAFRTQFIKESLEELDRNLQERGSCLNVIEGTPEAVIPQLASQLGVSAVFAHKEVGTEEAGVESGLEDGLFPLGIDLKLFWGRTLLNLTDLPMPIRYIPEVFTQFRKEVERSVTIRPQFPSPKHISSPIIEPQGSWKGISEKGCLARKERISGVLPFKGGELAGTQRIHEYIWEKDLLKIYKETRNQLLGGDYSSKFSPWLALGCISPRTIYEEVKKYEKKRLKNDSTYWLIFELLWRDYFHFIGHKHGKKLFATGGIRNRVLNTTPDPFKWKAWKEGITGVPFVDANMRELKKTGFMSNRGRQNVASFLVNDLGQDWRRGAAYFESQLIDYDVCSNWGNWNYVAGVGNDPRKHRYFNVISQGKRYDPKGEYVKYWIPELTPLPPSLIHEPWSSPEEVKRLGVELGKDYPYSFLTPISI